MSATDDDIKATSDAAKALAAAYAKGYAAGQRRKARLAQADARERREAEAYNRALLVMVPAAMSVENWKRGDKAITSQADRFKMAEEWAQLTLQGMRLW